MTLDLDWDRRLAHPSIVIPYDTLLSLLPPECARMRPRNALDQSSHSVDSLNSWWRWLGASGAGEIAGCSRSVVGAGATLSANVSASCQPLPALSLSCPAPPLHLHLSRPHLTLDASDVTKMRVGTQRPKRWGMRRPRVNDFLEVVRILFDFDRLYNQMRRPRCAT